MGSQSHSDTHKHAGLLNSQKHRLDYFLCDMHEGIISSILQIRKLRLTDGKPLGHTHSKGLWSQDRSLVLSYRKFMIGQHLVIL